MAEVTTGWKVGGAGTDANARPSAVGSRPDADARTDMLGKDSGNAAALRTTGVVVIGRNEGERLRRSLQSIPRDVGFRVYVDSDSSDGSADLARGMGWNVVSVDASRPMSAARSRNEGLRWLGELYPAVEFVQFVDGDSSLVAGWMGQAVEELRRRPASAVVFGRLQELNPSESIYNRLCAMEWNGPDGASYCGGIFLARLAALQSVGGFDEETIAGEEPELIRRLETSGYEVARLDAEMALHDSHMTSFLQWWRRNVRTGSGFAHAVLQANGDNSGVRHCLSILLWGLMLPLIGVASALISPWLAAAALGLYPLLAVRIALGRVRRGHSAGASFLYGCFTVVGKFAQLWGMARRTAQALTQSRPVAVNRIDPQRISQTSTSPQHGVARRIAYLTNQYPKVSHSFIRREIEAMESAGCTICRFSIRPCPDNLVDPRDKRELTQTRVILDIGVPGLLAGLARLAFTRPIRLLKATSLAVRMGHGSDRGVLRHLAYVVEACVLLRWIEMEQANHLHAHFGTNPAAVAMLCRELGGPPFSFTSHGIETFDRPEAIALDRKISRASFAAAVCDYGAAQLHRWCDRQDWPKLHVVRCGVDEMFLGAELTPVPAAPRLVCVGRLSEEKGHLLLIRSIARLASEGVEVKLVLVGDGPLRREIEACCAEQGLRQSVEITGWADAAEVRRQIQAARATVLPSFAEGLPVVIMESLALGRPVISTFVAGIPELVVPGETGWLVPAGSVDALTEAVRKAVLADPEELSRMGRAGAARVATMHDARREAGKLFELITQEGGGRDPIAIPNDPGC